MSSWQLSDLKRIHEARSQRRADSLLKRVKRLANDFVHRAPTEESLQKELSFDTEADIRRSLFILNPATKIIRIERSMVCCKIPRLEGFPRLLAPYGLKGGAARLGLQALLGDDVRMLRPRDIDVVRFGPQGDKEQQQLDREIAEQHMPDDAAHGHGVEVIESIDGYLASRDFTINEVVLMGGQIVATPQALKDLCNGIVRPTKHLLEGGEMLEGKSFMKALRFCAEMKSKGRAGELVDVAPHCLASPFDVALHLARALETNAEVAERYLELAFAYGALDAAEFAGTDIEHIKAGLSQILGPSIDLFSESLHEEKIKPVGIGFSVQRS